MLQADDAYAGSQSFIKLQKAAEDVLGKKYLLPVHQAARPRTSSAGPLLRRATLSRPTTILRPCWRMCSKTGGKDRRALHDHALGASFRPSVQREHGSKIEACIQKHGVDKIPLSGWKSMNLIGGQPFSMSNLMDVRRVADKYGIMLVLDASLLGENALPDSAAASSGRKIDGRYHQDDDRLADLVYFLGPQASVQCAAAASVLTARICTVRWRR